MIGIHTALSLTKRDRSESEYMSRKYNLNDKKLYEHFNCYKADSNPQSLNSNIVGGKDVHY